MKDLPERGFQAERQIKDRIVRGLRPSWPTPAGAGEASSSTVLSTTEQLQLLCADMWHADPDARPPAATIVQALQGIVETELQGR